MQVVRSTLWFEFTRQNIERFSLGPFALVPAMTVRPVSLPADADVVADCVATERADDRHLAGPDVITLLKMTKALPHRRRLLVPVRVPGAAGRALRHSALLPDQDIEVIGPHFSTWLTRDDS